MKLLPNSPELPDYENIKAPYFYDEDHKKRVLIIQGILCFLVLLSFILMKFGLGFIFIGCVATYFSSMLFVFSKGYRRERGYKTSWKKWQEQAQQQGWQPLVLKHTLRESIPKGKIPKTPFEWAFYCHEYPDYYQSFEANLNLIKDTFQVIFYGLPMVGALLLTARFVYDYKIF
jgi:hypothetical protein